MSALPAATRLGPYEIVSAIGAGGPMMDFTVWHAPYDDGADGRFLINTSLMSPTASPITVISNSKN